MLADEYTLDEFKKLFSILDEATVDNLYKVNFMMEPVDNFPAYVARTEIRYAKQYNKLIRDESVQYDAMITDYMERLATGKRNSATTDKTGLTEDITGSNNYSKQNTGTQKSDGSNNDTTTTTYDTQNKTAKAGTESTTHSNTNLTSQGTDGNTHEISGGYTDRTDEANAAKSNPMSVSYGGTVAGENGIAFPDLSNTWDTSDSQNAKHTASSRQYNGYKETDHAAPVTTTDNGEDVLSFTDRADTTTNTGSDKTTGNGSTSNTRTDNLNETYNAGNTSKKTSTTDGLQSTDESTKDTERYSGRHGYSPAELLSKSRDYILGTDAFRWLESKFDVCFEWEVNL